MKLIHSGKVLKDADTIATCNIKPNDFLVVMITKAKKAAPKPVAAAPTPAAVEKKEEKKEEPKTPAAAPAPAASSSATESSAAESAAATDTATTPAPSSAPSAAPPAPSRPADDGVSDEAVANLTAMGFPEAEVRACLRASGGNPDVAVEFLTNGIPPGIQEAQQAGISTPAAGAPSSSSGGGPLAALRAHPQLNQLRRLVQSNPQMLQQVLTQIGQQNPELLREINGNQAAFLELMNEPITDDAPAPAPSAGAPASAGGSSSSGGIGAGGGGAGGMAGMLPGMDNPAQMAQMLQNMSPQELQSMAAVMGLTPEQLQTMAQMIGQMPPEQFQEYMSMAMQGGGMGGMGGAGAGAMGGMGGPQVLRLNEEEMAAVDRLADMGFDRAEAAQAYLACDKNEALAANLLMDGGFADDGGNAPSGGGASGGGAGSGGGNDDDDMYD
mmetsp:Transcript_20603/g.59814  ORF Transcript_20603/g.59814 Transcript_20603/m.59814 type:complete len:441 (-) Transcript_20603:396-1718(-)|eukprot:CAMPEP_0113598996 /NCGR_PEP_ID=MMETSP0015_2-20120614/41897_1 /TAXON_ID=2838 /ORGANISM="Odontella" /LENGTH=440 /DNA_ID=CAMNT_0000507075 /DNA_START=1205 /DNA_END=2527 /DNA_ORIENTATION=+ /assembly_acc=CAM_ASM_000160